MSDTHPADHEELLRRLALGEIAESGPEAAPVVARCAVCRDRLESHRSVEAALRRAAAVEAAVLEEAEALSGAPGSDRVEPTRAAAAPTSPPARGRSGTRRVALALAAAVVVAAALWAITRLDPDAQPDEPLGSRRAIRSLSPDGGVRDFSTFAWSFDLPGAAWFEITIRAEGGATPLIVSPRLRETAWTPPAEALRALPDRIEWEVVARDRPESALARGSARAWRSGD